MPTEAVDVVDWWSSLNHGGLLIAPPRIPEFFSVALERMPIYRVERLRRDVTRVQADSDKGLSAFLDTVFEDLLALPPTQWQKAAAVDKRFSHPAVTGEIVRPQRVWQGSRDEILPLFVDSHDEGRIGVGRGRRQVSRVLEWLRALNLKVAVLTNGRQIRLIHAGADYDAFCEWDVDLWFEEGAPGPQVEALRRLLSVEAVSAKKPGETSPLLQAILASRRGQGELSAILGERVRQAVELLIQSSSTAIEETLSSGITKVQPTDVYIAATRTVMRLVVVLFAEARGLLPRENPSYHQSYGLQGLREELERSAGGRAERLRHQYSAWPRMLALFRLIYEGSSHEDLPIQQYGGGLFVPGHDGSQDPVLRALAALESPSSKQPITDDVVYRMIQLLTRSRMKVRQGRGATWVESPVDFSDLSSEYIGILYEGLLDFELRQVPKGDAIVFVNIGDQPALPFSRLQDMNNDELKKLFERLKAKPTAGDGEEEEEEAGDDEGEIDDDADDAGVVDVIETVDAGTGDDTRRAVVAYALDWAERAVKAAEIVKPPRGRQQTDPVARTRYQEDVLRAARALIIRIVTPGEWFLVRWGGTRKGAGTFYTRPQLAGPTIRRTLQPLAYAAVREQTDETTGLVDVLEWVPKKPEEILALKVCDPAMGSGSFLVSALRTLTEALFDSLHKHGRIASQGEGSVVRLADGATSKDVADELLPVRPEHPEFEPRLRARLKRHVVERCLYGVDIDAVAVELARMALWIETMDPALPFEFLDHKLKVGNSLIGCWFDRFQDYPLAAWERESGDEKHRGVHHEAKQWAEAMKSFKNDVVKPQLAAQLRSRRGQAPLFGRERKSADKLQADARHAMDDVHAIPVHDAVERARVYAARVKDDASLRELKRAFDAWCAIWFWPIDEVNDAPTPEMFHDLPVASSAIAAEISQREKFFHWEIEYPDVFVALDSGFDAVVGNPPWDAQKPSSNEFFSNLDPLYRTYTKQEALRQQQVLFANATFEHDWLLYASRFKALANWVEAVANPFGDPAASLEAKGISIVRGKESAALHDVWRMARAGRVGYADDEHPFRFQGSGDINTYKLFLELGRALLRVDGRLSFLVPSGIYSDLGTKDLRQVFLERSRWTHLYAFQNEKFVFTGIDHRFKIVSVTIAKGGSTLSLRTRFRLGPGDSPTADIAEQELGADAGYLPLATSMLARFSPRSRALLELSSADELRLVERLHDQGESLGELGVRYGRELDMTNDSGLFRTRSSAESQGYRQDEFGNYTSGEWKTGPGRPSDLKSANGATHLRPSEISDVCVPLYQGIMIQQHDPAARSWVSGTGVRAVWEPPERPHIASAPQYLVGRESFLSSPKIIQGWKVAYRRIARTTDTRTWIGTVLWGAPAGDSVFFLLPRGGSALEAFGLSAICNSLTYDYALRCRLAGTNLSWFILGETPAPVKFTDVRTLGQLAGLAASLAAVGPRYAAARLSLRHSVASALLDKPAFTTHERLRRRVLLEALVAALWGLSIEDYGMVVAGCDWPEAALVGGATHALAPRGFWRVGRESPPELRLPVLARVALHELTNMGIEAFMNLNGGEGWMLPQTLRLADYGMGHDERAKEHQPVASVLGPRFHESQLQLGVAESWEESARHAALLEQLLPTPKPESNAVGTPAGSARKTPRAGETNLLGEAVELDLLGNPITTTRKRRGR